MIHARQTRPLEKLFYKDQQKYLPGNHPQVRLVYSVLYTPSQANPYG